MSRSLRILVYCTFFIGSLLAQEITANKNAFERKAQNTNITEAMLKTPTPLSKVDAVDIGRTSLQAAYPISDVFQAVLTKAEFEFYVKSLSMVRGERCRHDLNETLWGIIRGDPWATAMYDSTVKSSVGLESAVLYQFGHYDQCLNQQMLSSPIHAQYCLVDLIIDGLNIHDITSRTIQLKEADSVRLASSEHQHSTHTYWGVCMPNSCDGRDIAAHVSTWLQRKMSDKEPVCHTQISAKKQISNGMLIYACVLCFFILLVLVSTLYHTYLLNSSTKQGIKEAGGNTFGNGLAIALLSFSIIENAKKLTQASRDQMGLNSINGIKALAMLLILAGHALSFILGGPMYNVKFIHEQLRLPTFSFLTNSLLFVDTFLLLSGFLMCRIMLIELERRHGKINVIILYLARYMRLTPAYLAIIGFYMTWFPHVGSGPIWEQRIELEQQRCQESWWLNILYINNYINTKNLCMFQSWYLSVDSQLFFVAPAIIYILYRSRSLGLKLIYALVIITTIIPFIVTYTQHLDPTLMVYSDEVHDLAKNEFYIKTYIKTHMRASSYVIGVLVGYWVHIMHEKHIKLSLTQTRCIWVMAIFIGVGSMYGVTRFYIAPYSILESSFYAGLHKLGWNLAMGWLVLAVTTNHAGWLQRALSIRIFAPISRLTYCAYLCNGIVELYHMASVRYPNYMGYISLANGVFSHTLDTFLLAIVVCLVFESPIHGLERVLLRRFDRSDGRSTNREACAKVKETPSTSEERI